MAKMSKAERAEMVANLAEQLAAVNERRADGWKERARNLRRRIKAVLAAGA